MRHIHLQPLGGIAGDMFVACLLDAFPEHRDAVTHTAAESAGVACQVDLHRDDTQTGCRFTVADPAHAHHHHHTTWRDIRRQISDAALPSLVRDHAIGIFTVLAEAEARVHGVTVDAVSFHELGATDSVADIVAAAAVIAAVSPASWSVSPLPLGGGVVQTAHGVMTVPAPATALLLEGFALLDDGIAGERVTPTGAAILRHLGCATAPFGGGILRRSGTGFGTRRLPGRSNCLRALVCEIGRDPAQGQTDSIGHRELAVISFEVDDQSGEDLALGVARIRAADGVHDVVQMPCFGKKSRLGVHIQVLTAPESSEEIIRLCFQETTTIGLRTQIVQGQALRRRMTDVDVAGQTMPVKLVDRPLGDGSMVTTAKVEADAVQGFETHASRTRIRREAEHRASDRDERGGAT